MEKLLQNELKKTRVDCQKLIQERERGEQELNEAVKSFKVEHTSIVTKIIEDAKKNGGDLAVLWLDLTNAYGRIPHKLVDLTLKTYHVPERFQKLLQHYYNNFNMHFT
ncbi:hypothetical protein QQF64_009036 [Cirrhinus molitorella]|uniref:Reverse transcriptase domain-containing protein n=1 Tax=Cirrhinus molitorella TaxID=172907 RepID=A0ABR3MB76_9TELE